MTAIEQILSDLKKFVAKEPRVDKKGKPQQGSLWLDKKDAQAILDHVAELEATVADYMMGEL